MTVAQTYQALLRFDCERKKPTAAERAGMERERERLLALVELYTKALGKK